MTTLRLLFNSLWHYRKLNIGLIAFIALTSTLITGALILGDSVSHSLMQLAQTRIGQIQWVIQGNNYFFQSNLAPKLHTDLQSQTEPSILLSAVVSTLGGQSQLPNVSVVGVNTSFFSLSPHRTPINILPGQVLLNQKAADQLQCKANDTLLIMIEKPTALPTDAPFAERNEMITLRVKVQAVILPNDFGDFSLQINPQIPANVFLDLAFLSEKINQPNRCNTLFIAAKPKSDLTHQTVSKLLATYWSFKDTPLQLVELPQQNQFAIRSADIFLANRLHQRILPLSDHAEPVFTYFVNSLKHLQHSTPYSMVSNLPQASGITLRDNAIILNTWLAKDLHAQPGDNVTLQYYIIDDSRKLNIREHTFTVQAVVPITGWANDKTRMPDFPGLSDAGNCRDWEPGIPIDLSQIRPKDEDYWDQYRGTPKAYISLAQAQALWSNAFGDLTGIRFPISQKQRIVQDLDKQLTPELFGIQLTDIHAAAQQSAKESIDFSQLFLGLSFFMVLSGLLLLGLFFGFAMDKRWQEVRLLRAIGFTQTWITRRFLSEGILIAIIGSLIGLISAIGYNQILLYGLQTLWYDAVRTTALQIHIQPLTLGIGFVAALITAVITIMLSLRTQFKRTLSESQHLPGHWPRWIYRLNSILFFFSIGTLSLILLLKQTHTPVVFVLLGIVFLIHGLLFFAAGFDRPKITHDQRSLSIQSLALKNIRLRMKNSLSIVALLAMGVFMILSVSANRQSPVRDAANPASGTGGFSLFCETTRPMIQDIHTVSGQKNLGLDPQAFNQTSFALLRRKSGNDASCLNINRTLMPQIVSVNPDLFVQRKSFTFAGVQKNINPENKNPWELLNQPLANKNIPAIADQTVIQWGLGKKLGDTLTLTNDQGELITLQLVAGLANSIFQGNILISEKAFLQNFPSISGFQMMLVDTPVSQIAATQKTLTHALLPYGIVITKTAERLAEFNTIQNTYLSIFLLLGGLGLMLSTLGLGIVLARNLEERKGEAALLLAIGYSRTKISVLYFSEYAILLFSGISMGVLAALVGILPSLITPGTQLPYVMLCLVILGILSIGTTGLYFGSQLALPSYPAEGLRQE